MTPLQGERERERIGSARRERERENHQFSTQREGERFIWFVAVV